ncbi:MAG TPA: hypothetical protein VGQ48_09485 [Gemmatimonadales bacterium]|jgi:hypothetical protein|nr:hypothetical protein [Gemmatimonadales bacterium]
MSPLAVRIGAGVLALLALLALRGKRWAYLAFVVLGLLYFPAQTHFRVHVPKCEQLIPTMRLVVLSLHNYAYIALFAGFYWMSWVQFRKTEARVVWALLATLLGGALVEVAEAMTGRGHCRVRDLVPDAAGALGAALLLAVWSRLRRKPAYVRIVRPRPAVAQPRGVVSPMPAPPRRVVPPPPDFSPGPSPGAPPEDVAPTQEVAPSEEVTARPEVVQRLQAILQRLRAMLQRIWAITLGRRRTIVVGVVLIALVGAAAFVVLRLQAPAPVVTEQPKAALPPPPRPLQSDAEGYYEPGYQFTVSDRRFTRLTLRPEPFVTFSRVGTRQEAGCEDARIGPDAVHLRCELDRVGMVTIDGRFTSRFVTSRLDIPVLSALITVTSTRGETLYRARDAFVWHPPN